MRTQRREAFTLIEVLIVVVITALLAAVVIPQFSASTKDSRQASAKFGLQTLRSQIELYRNHHSGSLPAYDSALSQLVGVTDATGAISPTGTPDATYPYGPYLQGAMPNNPFPGLNTVKRDTNSSVAPSATAAPGGGWIYRDATGEIWIDHPDYVTW